MFIYLLPITAILTAKASFCQPETGQSDLDFIYRKIIYYRGLGYCLIKHHMTTFKGLIPN